VLALIAGQPDLTLLETVAELRKRRIRTSRSSLWRFLGRHSITLKKSLQAAERQRADVARALQRLAAYCSRHWLPLETPSKPRWGLSGIIGASALRFDAAFQLPRSAWRLAEINAG